MHFDVRLEHHLQRGSARRRKKSQEMRFIESQNKRASMCVRACACVCVCACVCGAYEHTHPSSPKIKSPGAYETHANVEESPQPHCACACVRVKRLVRVRLCATVPFVADNLLAHMKHTQMWRKPTTALRVYLCACACACACEKARVRALVCDGTFRRQQSPAAHATHANAGGNQPPRRAPVDPAACSFQFHSFPQVRTCVKVR